MKSISYLSVLGLTLLFSHQGFSQEKVKDTPEKIVTIDKNAHVKTKEKANAFLAKSDSVRIKDRHGRIKTKDFTNHTVIKEKGNSVKFKNKQDGSWMKERNGRIKTSKNYLSKSIDSLPN